MSVTGASTRPIDSAAAPLHSAAPWAAQGNRRICVPQLAFREIGHRAWALRRSPEARPGHEGVAQLFTAAKLERMREAGVTRVSLGVQQLDPALLALSGRKLCGSAPFTTCASPRSRPDRGHAQPGGRARVAASRERRASADAGTGASPGVHRRERRGPRRPGAHEAGGAHRCTSRHPGRVRHRKGPPRAHPPRAEPTPREAVPGRALRRPGGQPAGERALWPRAGRVHGGRGQQARPLRAGRWRDPVPRRVRRDEPRRCRRSS
jgi:hypothetical protein